MKGLWSFTVLGALLAILAGCGAGDNTPTSFVRTSFSQLRQPPAPRVHRAATSNEFLYVANYGSDSVTAYKINTKNGKLARVKGSPFAAGTSPIALAVDPSANYVYVGNDGSGSCTSGNISAYSINARTGALAQLSGSPYSGMPCPITMTITPNGAYLYGTNIAHYDSVSAYSIAGNGALTAISGSPFSTCAQPEGMTVAPSGNFAYVTCTLYSEFDGEIDAYTIDQSSGALTLTSGSPYSTGLIQQPEVLPAGGYLFVPEDTNQTYNYVLEYAIDTSSGDITAVSGSPFADGFETYPSDVAITPSNRFVYVTNGNSNNIAAYSISPSGGGLMPVSGSPFGGGTSPHYAAVDSTGNFLYVVNLGSNNISAFRINQRNGSLTSVAGSPFATGKDPYEVGVANP